MDKSVKEVVTVKLWINAETFHIIISNAERTRRWISHRLDK